MSSEVVVGLQADWYATCGLLYRRQNPSARQPALIKGHRKKEVLEANLSRNHRPCSAATRQVSNPLPFQCITFLALFF